MIRDPAPPHDGQVDWSMKKPAFRPTTPRPAQDAQVDFDVPGLAPEPEQVVHPVSYTHLTLPTILRV